MKAHVRVDEILSSRSRTFYFKQEVAHAEMQPDILGLECHHDALGLGCERAAMAIKNYHIHLMLRNSESLIWTKTLKLHCMTFNL